MAHASTNLIDTHTTTGSADGSRALGLLARAFARVTEQRRVNRTIATLSELSDRTLADIGIERSEIERIARYGRKLSNRDL
jgi:uncharacterized protein YjiS (DUF1127 family)